jgi:cytochrome b
MQRIRVWDPLVRVFHWSLVGLFTANALIVDDDSKLHNQIGYAVVALVGIRIVWGIVGTRYARFSSFPPSVTGAVEQLTEIATGRSRVPAGHSALGAWMIYNLLLAMLVIGLSGHLMTTDMFWGKEWPEELHEFAVAWAEISVVIHVAAVLFESARLRTNLPRAMVTGYKEISSERARET